MKFTNLFVRSLGKNDECSERAQNCESSIAWALLYVMYPLYINNNNNIRRKDFENWFQSVFRWLWNLSSIKMNHHQHTDTHTQCAIIHLKPKFPFCCSCISIKLEFPFYSTISDVNYDYCRNDNIIAHSRFSLTFDDECWMVNFSFEWILAISALSLQDSGLVLHFGAGFELYIRSSSVALVSERRKYGWWVVMPRSASKTPNFCQRMLP